MLANVKTGWENLDDLTANVRKARIDHDNAMKARLVAEQEVARTSDALQFAENRLNLFVDEL